MLDKKLVEIARQIHDYFFESERMDRNIDIFLCGGASKDQSNFRDKLKENITARSGQYRYSVYYPESLFLELIMGHKQHDLLELENLLAESVSAVVIPLQSPGTFTELGAFANHPTLRNKLVVLVDPQFKTSQSFINTGPVRQLKLNTSSEIIYHSLVGETDMTKLAKLVSDSCRKIAAIHPVRPALTNPLTAQDFFWALIYVLEPMSELDLLAIVNQLANDKVKPQVHATAMTVINTLVNKRDVLRTGHKLLLPPEKLELRLREIPSKKNKEALLDFLSPLRIDAMNLILRKRNFAM